MTTKQEISEFIYKALASLSNSGEIPAEPLPAFSIETPENPLHGDFSVNAALVSAKALKLPPRKTAELLVKNIDLTGSSFDKFEIAGPGFINFFCGNSYYANNVIEVLSRGENFGRTELYKNKTALVEFVSANPTGPMHIGNARGGATGDTLAGVLEFAGYDTKREFYVNDAGNQILKFGASLEARYLQLKGKDVEITDDMYKGEDIKKLAEGYISETENADLTDKTPAERQDTLVKYALPKNIEALEKDLLKYRISYDNWFRESSLHEKNSTEDIISKLTERGETYEKDGAIWFNAKKYGVNEDVVLKRSNGIVTYIVPDIAYHYDKLVGRGFDVAIDVLGADHFDYASRLKAALSALGIENVGKRLKIVIMQMVRLVRVNEGGEKEVVKLSKRSGKAITLNTLLDEIPVDVARFFFNLRDSGTHLEFDLDLAIEESNKNPVYYVQYAYARICGMLKRLETEGFILDKEGEFKYAEQSEKDLVNKIAAFPSEINLAAENLDPSRLTKYAMSLAATFHKFYDSCRIKGEETVILNSRLALSTAAKITLANVLKILKVTAPERM